MVLRIHHYQQQSIRLDRYPLLRMAMVFQWSKKVKWSRYRSGVAQRVRRGITLLFHDRGTRRGWVVSSAPRPHFNPRKDPVPIVQEAGWAPGPVWTGVKSRPHQDSIPDRPARSQSLYQLSYPAHVSMDLVNIMKARHVLGTWLCNNRVWNAKLRTTRGHTRHSRFRHSHRSRRVSFMLRLLYPLCLFCR